MSTTALSDIIPQIEEIRDYSPFHQRITMGPFERGYGHTLGNSLRRVLLSGMPGYAPTEVRIDGVEHQYSTIQGIAEDVTEILLNLKGIAFRLEGNASVDATIDKKGSGDVTAADIKLPGNVQVFNPEHHIARLADDARLKMTIKIEGGRGYLPASDPARGKAPHGCILLDAAFSPVRNVGIEVEGARVASRTDLDRLVIDLKTNGILRPEELIRYAARILIRQLEVFADMEHSEDVLDKIGRRDKTADNPIFYEPIEDRISLPVKLINNLKQESILLVGDLVSKSEREMLNTPRFGRKSVDEIKLALAALDMSLGMELENFNPDRVSGSGS